MDDYYFRVKGDSLEPLILPPGKTLQIPKGGHVAERSLEHNGASLQLTFVGTEPISEAKLDRLVDQAMDHIDNA